jgi:hypothetical protein
MASLRASSKLEKNESAAVLNLMELSILDIAGAASDNSKDAMATTTTTSISVKPAHRERSFMRINSD